MNIKDIVSLAEGKTTHLNLRDSARRDLSEEVSDSNPVGTNESDIVYLRVDENTRAEITD